jgi:hypothetical protein
VPARADQGSGTFGSIGADCSQFANDLLTEIDYPKSQVPPIPNATDQAQWQSSLHQLYTGTTACASAAKANDISAFTQAVAKLVAGAKLLSVTNRVQNAWKMKS